MRDWETVKDWHFYSTWGSTYQKISFQFRMTKPW